MQEETNNLENENRILKADDFVDYFKKTEMVDTGNVKKMLLEMGMKEKDIDTAFDVITCVLGVNSICSFSKKFRLEFNASKNTKLLAGYVPTQQGEEEKYVSYVAGSEEEVESRCKERGLTRAEILLQVAIHEVRHRLQYQQGFSLFTFENAQRHSNGLLLDHANRLKELESRNIQIAREFGRDEEFIRKRINEFEFDTELIEFFLLNNIRKGISISDFLGILTMQPEIEKNE